MSLNADHPRPKTTCPNCKKLVPCGLFLIRNGKVDILDRIKDFQARLWEKKQKDSLESIAEDIVKEVINLRIKATELSATCPHCNNRISYSASDQKNQRDIIERIKELQVRLKEKKSKETAYAILEDALMEIDRLRSTINTLSGKK
jgi:hypothetical protein